MPIKKKITEKQGQIFIITVVLISISLFSIYLLLNPVHNKIIKIKEGEYINQAYANAESVYEMFKYFSEINSGLEATTSRIGDFIMNKATSAASCGGLTLDDNKVCLIHEVNYFLSNMKSFFVIDNIGNIGGQLFFSKGEFKNFIRIINFYAQ